MDKKVLYGVIVFLAVALILQTGYLIGKRTVEEEHQEGKVTAPVPVKGAKQAAEYHRVDTVGGGVKPPAGQAFGTESWDPFEEMMRMQRVMNRMFNDSFGRARDEDDLFSGMNRMFDPAIDVREEDDAYFVFVDLPGVDKDTINVNAHPNSVTVSGERVIENERRDGSTGIYRSERSFGSFRRTIPLTHKINTNEVTAETVEGVLMIRLPKVTASGDETEGRKVKVQ